jgi:DNA-binding CsgD family transcriptional regulator
MSASGHRYLIDFALTLRLPRCGSCSQRKSTSTTMNLLHANSVSSHRSVNACPLSTREREVLKWVGAGKTSWETGQVLGIAESTVNNHLKAIKAKLGMANRVQAVSHAERAGWL